MKQISFIFLIIQFACIANQLTAQSVGIGTNTPHASARLDISATNKGLLIPRMGLISPTDNTTIPNPAFGLLIINYNNEMPEGDGLYIQSIGEPTNPKWRRLSIVTESWLTTGNTNSVAAKLGHTDNRPIQFVVSNQHIARLGGNKNILLGRNTGNGLSITENFSSYANIAIGNDALSAATIGTHNIAIGGDAMGSATGGSTGIAIGGSTLVSQADGALENIAIGFSSVCNHYHSINLWLFA